MCMVYESSIVNLETGVLHADMLIFCDPHSACRRWSVPLSELAIHIEFADMTAAQVGG